MRCANHPDRIATQICTLCGTHHCEECLVEVGGEPHCRRCAPSARASQAGAAAEAGGREGPPRSWRGRLALGATVGVLAVGLVLLAVVPGRQRDPEPAWTPPDQRADRNTRAIAALERAAIAIETFHAERGRHPSSWDEVVPDLAPEPVPDPWSDGGALQLRVPSWDPTALVLYSVGPDGRDDGGQVYTPETGLGDLVYIVR